MKNGSSLSVKSPRSVSWNNSGHIPNTKMDMKKKVTEYQNFSLLCAFSQKFIWKPKVKEISCSSFAVNQANQSEHDITSFYYIVNKTNARTVQTTLPTIETKTTEHLL